MLFAFVFIGALTTILFVVFLLFCISSEPHRFKRGAKGKHIWTIFWSSLVALSLLSLTITIPSYEVAIGHFNSEVQSAAAKQHLRIANIDYDNSRVVVIGGNCSVTATVSSGKIFLPKTQGDANPLSPQLLAAICK